MSQSKLKVYIIRKYKISSEKPEYETSITFPEDSTYEELKKEIEKKYPTIFKKEFILSVNGYNPILSSKIDKNISLIKIFEQNKEEIIDINHNESLTDDENISNEEEEEECSSDVYGQTLDSLLNKKKQNLGKKRDRENKNNNDFINVIEFNNNYEVISDFAPTKEELYDIFFTNKNSPIQYKNNQSIKKIFDPEKFIKKNNINKKFLNIEELTLCSIESTLSSNKKNDHEIKEEKNNKNDILEDLKIKTEKINKETYEDILKTKEKETIKFEKIKNEKAINNIKEEKDYYIKKEREYNNIKNESLNKIKNDEIEIIEIKEEINEKNEEEKLKEKKTKQLNLKRKKEEEIKKEKQIKFCHIIDINIINIKKILEEYFNCEKIPSFELRIKYSKIINFLRNNYKPEKYEKRLNFIFDLDNTLIHGYASKRKKKNSLQLDYHYKYEEFIFGINQFDFYFHIRKGIEKLFEEIKEIGYFYIYTLAVYNYALIVKTEIEQLCKITFEKMITNKGNNRTKNIEKLFIKEEEKDKTLILDDLITVWEGPTKHYNVIPSMIYLNTKINKFIIESYENKIIENEYKDYEKGYYNYIDIDEDWLNNKIRSVPIPFFNKRNNQFYHIETEQNKKNQLEYIGKIYKTVYNILDFINLKTMICVKMIKMVIFAGMIFNIDFYVQNQEHYDILFQLITVCGGEIDNHKDTYLNYYDEYIFVCDGNLNSNQLRNDIEKIKKKYHNFFLVNESYIFDCNYCITKFSPQEYEIRI